MTVNQQTRDISLTSIYVILAILAFLMAMNLMLDIYTPDIRTFRSSLPMIIGVGSIIVLGITAFNFRLSVALFVFVIPLANYHIPNMPFHFTSTDAYLIVLVIVYFIRYLMGKEPGLQKTFLDRTIFLFLLWILISSFNTPNMSKSMREFVKMAECLLFCYLLISSVVRTRRMLEVMIQVILLVSALVSIHGIYQYLSLGDYNMRIKGSFGHFNALGAYLAMTTTFLFNLQVSTKNRRTKILYSIYLVLNVIALLLSFSRGAWIGCIIGIVISAQMKGMVNFIKYFSGLIVFIILFSLFSPERYLWRAASIPKITDAASKSRLEQYEIALEVISNYPVLGIGLGNMQNFATEVYSNPTLGEIHNLFLHIGSESGLPAMLLLLWIFGHFFIHIIRKISITENYFYYSAYLAIFSAIVSFAILNMFAYMFVRGPFMFFALLLGLYSACLYVEKNEPKDTEWINLLSSVNNKRPKMKMDF